VADRSSFASIGAAATLAAVFRAPLTASLLIFELTRGYELVLPLLAAAGTGPLVAITFDAATKRRSADAAGTRGGTKAGSA
jgi:H+/Cl- antiporter ClcA